MNETRNKIVVFGGGCFWCTEAVVSELRGVISVKPGYSGGKTPNPTYEAVCGGTTGHAEVIRIEYDPSQIAFKDLLTVFFATHNPTTKNRQENDVGTQYRSVVFFTDEEQKSETESYIKELTESKTFGKPIVTEVEPLANFYEAEDYHKNYYNRNTTKAYCELIISPKIQKLYSRFSDLLKHNHK